MKQFNGFPDKSQYTPLPNIFFSTVLPEITDLAELKVTLHLFQILYPRKGHPKFITLGELLNDVSLRRSLQEAGKDTETALQEALELALKRGTILNINVEKDGSAEAVYLINTAPNREAVRKIKSGELKLEGLKAKEPPSSPPVTLPDIFTVYEENIGMLTPLVADELREAEKLYPADWVWDAIKQAVIANKRRWSYIERILERWSAEGKSDGTHQRYLKENNDPDKYVKGKYGHIVQR